MAACWLDELNPAQREAVTHGDGPLLVVAGAGTGKTKTLVCRVAWLIDRGVRPDRILLLTFTRRAAAEMLTRAARLLGDRQGGATGKVWGGTFHAVANRLLRIYGRALGLAGDFTVMDQSDAADLMNLIRSDLGLAKQKRRFPRKQTLVSLYSRMVNAREKLTDAVRRHFPWCEDDHDGIRRIFEQYTTRKRAHNLLDYDDLLLMWNALAADSGVGPTVADRFDHVLVDEYQDTNPVQADLLRGMRRRYQNIMAVGDDAQSIYSFRAATVRNILDFPKHFPGTRVVTLEQNYRSRQPILEASNAVMAQARERYTKELWSERGGADKPLLCTCLDEPNQCDAVCGHILAHLEQGIPLHRQAVLFRAGHHSDQLEVELARRNIPFRKYGGLKFVEAAHVKDLLALLRILENPYDEMSWFRVLQLLPGIGPRLARRIMAALGVGAEGGGDLGGREGEAPAEPYRPGEAPAKPDRTARQEPRPPDPADPLPASDGPGSPNTFAPPLRCLMEEPPSVPPAAQERFAALRDALADCVSVGRVAHGDVRDAEPSPKRQRGDSDPSLALRARRARGDREDRKLDRVDEPHDGLPVATQIERLRRFYEPVCKEVYENAAVRLRDLEQLEQIAAGYQSRSRFVTDLTLDPPESASDLAGPPHLDDDYLVLSTIHSAKGCEWDVVHVIHAADGMIPSDMAVSDEAGVDEERRLLYVAMTRAKNWLYVYFPLRYYYARFGRGDAHGYAQLSRYLTGPVRALFESRAAFADLAEDAPTGVRPLGSVDDWVRHLLHD